MPNEIIGTQEDKILSTKQKSQIFIETCLKLFFMATILSFLIKFITGVDLYTIVLYKNITIPKTIGYIINTFALFISVFVIIILVNNDKSKNYSKSLIFTLCFVPLFFALNYFSNDVKTIFSFLIPIILPLVPLTKIKYTNRILRLIFFNLLFIILTALLSYIKFTILKLGYNNQENVIISLIYGLDLFILYYFIVKNNKNNENTGGNGNVFTLVFRRCRCLCKRILCKERKEIKQKIKRPIGFYIFLIKTQFLQLAIVLFCSCFLIAGIRSVSYPNIRFMSELIRCFVIFIYLYFSFVYTRIIYKTSWHAKTIFICSAITCIVFFFICSGQMPLSISIYTCILSGSFLSYMLNIIGEKFNKADSFDSLYTKYEIIQKEKKEMSLEKRILELELKQEKEKPDNEEKEVIKKLYSLTEQNLREFLHEKMLSVPQIEALVLHIHKDMKWSEVRIALSYSRSGIDFMVSEIKNKLGIKSKARL